jgi:hypothetical protein
MLTSLAPVAIYLGLSFLIFIITRNKQHTIKPQHIKYLVVIAFTYMVIPTILFLPSLPVINILKIFVLVLTLVFYIKFIRITLKEPNDVFGGEYNIKAGYLFFAIGLLIISYFGLFQGNGFVVDWPKHRSILASLYNDPFNPTLSGFQIEDSELLDRPLIYYYSMYMPATYLSIAVTNLFKIVDIKSISYILSILFTGWNTIGLIISFLLMPIVCRKLFRLNVEFGWSIFYFGLIVFSGLDYWAKALMEGKIYVSLADNVGDVFPYYFAQIPSFLSHWQFIPNQLIATLLGISVLSIYQDRIDRFPLFLWSTFLVTSSSLAWITILPILLYLVGCWIFTDKGVSIRRKVRVFFISMRNEIWSSAYLAIILLYIFSNRQYTITLGINRSLMESLGGLSYIMFILVELLPFAIILLISKINDNKIPKVVMISIIILLFLPLFQLGLKNDLVLKGSLPLICIIILYSAVILQKAIIRLSKITAVLILIFIIMTIPHFENEYYYGLNTNSENYCNVFEGIKQYMGVQNLDSTWLIFLGVIFIILINIPLTWMWRLYDVFKIPAERGN